MKNIYIVPQELIHQAWNRCKSMIMMACDYAPSDGVAEHMKVALTQGSAKLMLFIEDDDIVGAVCFCWKTTPAHRVFHITALGGKTTKEHADKMFEYAKQNGATVIRGEARESVARLWRQKYGFQEISRVVEKVL